MGRAHQVRAASMAKTAAAKSKLNNKWSKIIYMAAKSGIPDPEVNLSLKQEIAKARKEQVNADVIKNAINKAKGGSNESYTFHRYEGFGPNNSMIIVDCLTDNTNRTFTDVRIAFTKSGCKLGVSGCVAHMFNPKSVFSFEGLSADDTFEALMMADCDVEDVQEEDGVTTVYAAQGDFNKIREVLVETKPDLEFLEEAATLIPDLYVTLEEESDKAHFEKLLSMLDESDDVQDVYHNVEE